MKSSGVIDLQSHNAAVPGTDSYRAPRLDECYLLRRHFGPQLWGAAPPLRSALGEQA